MPSCIPLISSRARLLLKIACFYCCRYNMLVYSLFFARTLCCARNAISTTAHMKSISARKGFTRVTRYRLSRLKMGLLHWVTRRLSLSSVLFAIKRFSSHVTMKMMFAARTADRGMQIINWCTYTYKLRNLSRSLLFSGYFYHLR